MSEIWPIVEAGLTDGDASVRKAACVAVSCLCEWLEEECAAKHAVLVPVCPLFAISGPRQLVYNVLDDHEPHQRSRNPKIGLYRP